MRRKRFSNYALIAMLAPILMVCHSRSVSADNQTERSLQSVPQSLAGNNESGGRKLLLASSTDDWDFPALGFKCSPKRPHIVESVSSGYEAAQKGVLVGDEITDLESSPGGTSFVIKRAGKTYGVVLSSKGFHQTSIAAAGSAGAGNNALRDANAPLPSDALVPRNRLLSQPESRLSMLPTAVRPGAKFEKENMLALGQVPPDWEVAPEWLAGDWEKIPGTTKMISARNERTGRDFVPTELDDYVMDGPNLGSARDKSGNIWFHASVPEMVQEKNVALTVEPADAASMGRFALHYRNVFVGTNGSQIITNCNQEDVIDRFSPQGPNLMTCDELGKTYDENGTPQSSWRATCQMKRVKQFVGNPGAKYTLPNYLRKRGLPQLIP